ncbi:hypothetical protein VEZ01S_33_00430 [Vibrio ezurae NBRC 102218]|uniref:Uncharacterized protein n=1 Tax=Vibrio ezurae NBRC 102218 TaxID=1219080 RepID=U3AKB1_9VIBR|nr:hypothetical protein VEZ01S_33_00430 [Vibrio ezurae NBRC 102218]
MKSVSLKTLEFHYYQYEMQNKSAVCDLSLAFAEMLRKCHKKECEPNKEMR